MKIMGRDFFTKNSWVYDALMVSTVAITGAMLGPQISHDIEQHNRWASATDEQKIDSVQKGFAHLACVDAATGRYNLTHRDLPTRESISQKVKQDPSCELSLR